MKKLDHVMMLHDTTPPCLQWALQTLSAFAEA